VTTLPKEVNDCPVSLSLFEIAKPKFSGFLPAQAARQEQGQKSSISFAFEVLRIGRLQQARALLRGEPVPEPNAKLSQSMNPPDAGSQIGAQQSAVGGLVSETAHGSEAQIDRARSKPPRLEIGPVPENNDSVERQARLRAVPFDELVNRVAVTALGFEAGKAIQHSGFSMLEIGQAQNCPWFSTVLS
jgi:hypothetical protein